MLRLPQIAQFQYSLGLTITELELLYDWQFTVNQFVLAPSPSRFTTGIFLFFFFATELLPLYSLSLKNTGQFLTAILLLALGSTVIFGSESYRDHDHNVTCIPVTRQEFNGFQIR
jgi:hypothetical protein